MRRHPDKRRRGRIWYKRRRTRQFTTNAIWPDAELQAEDDSGASYLAARASPLGQLRADGRWECAYLLCLLFVATLHRAAAGGSSFCAAALLLAVAFRPTKQKHTNTQHTHPYNIYVSSDTIYVDIYFGSTGSTLSYHRGRGARRPRVT